MEITQEVNSETADLKTYFVEKCEQAGLTPEQTAQVVEFRLDPWWCNADSQAGVIIDFFRRQNEQVDCGPLCAEHGSPLDTSIDVVRLGLVSR